MRERHVLEAWAMEIVLRLGREIVLRMWIGR
jgi:hypothetical protein